MQPSVASFDMADQPLVTVITPAYNVGPYIREAIESVKAQTETRFEYLVIDDGSTDDTVSEILAAFDGDPRMRLIQNDHRGGAQARNTGIEQAQAPLISFLDGDDRWHPEKLAHQIHVLDHLGPEYGVVFSRSRLMSEDGLIIGLQKSRPGRHDLDDLLAENCPPRNGSSLLFRKSCFDEAGMFDPSFVSSTDFDVELRIAHRSSTPLYWADKRYLVDYRLRGGQISRGIDRRLQAVERILDTYVPLMQRLPQSYAYVDHAVFAHRGNDAERIARWSDLARSSGLPYLIRTGPGRRLLGWRLLGERGSAVYRAVTTRSLGVARTSVRWVADRVR